MREINFRIRSGSDFYYIGDLSQIKTFNFDLKDKPSIIWQQSTEVRDRDNNLIYEGDILQMNIGYIRYFYEVKFGYFKNEDYSATGFYLKLASKVGNVYPFSLTSNSNHKYIVAGNIFDNPQLLNRA